MLLLLVVEYGQAHLDLVRQGLLREARVKAEAVAFHGLSADLLGLGAIPDVAGRLLLDPIDG